MYGLAGWPNGAEAAAAVLRVETAIAAAQWTRVQNRDPEATYNPMSVADMVASYPNLRIDVWLREMGLAGRVDSVIVSQPPYLAALNGLMTSIPVADWQTYAKARTLTAAASLLPKAFADASFDFFGRQLSGQPADRARWKKAVSSVNGALGESVGRVYVSRHYPAAAAERMEQMILNLQEAFRRSIIGNPWMSETTKTEALKKLGTYVFKIGYPSEWEDYSALSTDPGDLLGNMRRTMAWRYSDMLSNLGSPVDRAEWGMTPQTVNAYYNPAFNEIVFPAAILQPPFFNVEADDAVNYGAIGAVIGHEFSHGFDDQGSQYDATGNLRNWWTESDRTAFDALTDRLVAQYGAYKPFEDAAVNGELTLGENIADVSGLTMAHLAYEISLEGKDSPVIDGFTGDQRFFMGWAQVWRITHREPMLRQMLQTDSHSPGQYRAVGPLAHIPGFYSAFDVQPGDGLYLAPADRIKLW